MKSEQQRKLVTRLKDRTTTGVIQWRDGLVGDMFVADVPNLGFLSLDLHEDCARLRVHAPISGSAAVEIDACTDRKLADELQALYATVAGASATETQAVEQNIERWLAGDD